MSTNFVEIYVERLKAWVFVPFETIRIGEVFFAYDDEGNHIAGEDGQICFIAASNAYFNGEEWVIDLEKI